MRTRINRVALTLFVFVALMPTTAWAGTGDVVGIGYEILNYVKMAIGYMTPAEPWMWPFTIGALWLMALNKAVRKNAHWVVYITFWPIFGGLWLLGMIPLFGRAIGFVRGLYSKIVNHSIESLGLTVRECTIGIFGCMILAGLLGGSWATSNQYWLYLGFLPIGTAGLGAMTGYIIEKIGGKDAKAKLKGASKGSLLSLWARFRYGVEDTEEPELVSAGPNVPSDFGKLDLQVICPSPSCDTLNPANAVVCQECGDKIGTSVAPAVAVSATQPVVAPTGAAPASVPQNLAKALDLADDDF